MVLFPLNGMRIRSLISRSIAGMNLKFLPELPFD